LKKEFGYVDADDGEFFMSFEDFMTNFAYTFVCKYIEGYKYNCVKQTQDPNALIGSKIEIKEDNCKIFFSCHQKQVRFFNKVDNYKTQYCRILIARFKDDKYSFVAAFASNDEKLCLETTLNKGEYHIYAKSYWPYEQFDNCSLTLSTYAKNEIPLLPLSTKSKKGGEFLEECLSSYTISKGKKLDIDSEGSVELYYTLSNNETGYYILTGKNNNTEKSYQIQFTFKFNNKLKPIHTGRCTFKTLESGQTLVTLLVFPNSSTSCILEMIDDPWHVEVSKVENFAFKELQVLPPLDDNINIDSVISHRIQSSYIPKTTIVGKVRCFEIERVKGVIIVVYSEHSRLFFNCKLNLKANTSFIDIKESEKEFELTPSSYHFIEILYKPDATECSLVYDIQAQSTKEETVLTTYN